MKCNSISQRSFQAGENEPDDQKCATLRVECAVRAARRARARCARVRGDAVCPLSPVTAAPSSLPILSLSRDTLSRRTSAESDTKSYVTRYIV